MDSFPTDQRSMASKFHERQSRRRNRSNDMDPPHSSGHDGQITRTQEFHPPQDWTNYRRSGNHGGPNESSTPYQYHHHYQQQQHQHQMQSYYYNPPYYRHHYQDNTAQQPGASFEDIPAPPETYYGHQGYSQHTYHSRNGPDNQYVSQPPGDGNTDVSATTYMNRPHYVRHGHVSENIRNQKPYFSSTMVTPIRTSNPETDNLFKVSTPTPALKGSKHLETSSTPNTTSRGTVSKTLSSPSRIIWELQEYDVLCGRGAPTNYHSGNTFLRKLVNENQTLYLCSKRSDKPAIAWKILELVHSRGGRFVRRNKAHSKSTNFAWEHLSDKQAYEKICQTLREGAPELRRRMLRNMKKGGGNRGFDLLRDDDDENVRDDDDEDANYQDNEGEENAEKNDEKEEENKNKKRAAKRDRDTEMDESVYPV